MTSIVDGLPPMPHKLESMAGPGQTNWVIKGRVLTGAHPGTISTTELVRNLTDILSAGVSTFVCLQAEMPSPMVSASHPAVGGTPGVTAASGAVVTARPYFDDAKIVQNHGEFPYKGPLSYVYLPIPESAGGVVDDNVLVPFVCNLIAFLKSGETMYIHCSSGDGRTGTVAALLLGLLYNMSSSETLDTLQRFRNSRPGTAGQMPDTHEQKMQVHRLLGDDTLRAHVATLGPKRSIETVKVVEADAENIHSKIRTALARRGASTVKALGRLFQIMDDDNSRGLDRVEFAKGLHDIGAGLSSSEVGLLFKYYDRDGDGVVSYDEFLRGVRGDMNARRKALVHTAFKTMDTDGSGIVTVDEIASTYNARQHPDVVAGKKSEKTVLYEFLDTFDVKERDRQVTIEEFEDYYSGVSASIDDDNYFQLMMWNAWPMAKAAAESGGGPAKLGTIAGGAAGARSKTVGAKAVSTRRKQLSTAWEAPAASAGAGAAAPAAAAGDDSAGYLKARVRTVPQLLEDLRKTMAKRGARGIVGLGRSFKIMDDDGSRSLNPYEFRKAMADVGLKANAAEVNSMFAAFDQDGGGSIDYEEFLQAVRGGMSEFRKGLVRQAFDKLDHDSSGVVELPEVMHSYNATKHPEVVAGKKTVEEVTREFMDTFDGGVADGFVHLDEFEKYYENVSASIDNDDYFKLMMWNAWNLGGTGAVRKYKKAWASEEATPTKGAGGGSGAGMLANFGREADGQETGRPGKRLGPMGGGSLYSSNTYKSNVPWDTRGGADPRTASAPTDVAAMRAQIRAHRDAAHGGGGASGGGASGSGGGGGGGAGPPSRGGGAMAGAPRSVSSPSGSVRFAAGAGAAAASGGGGAAGGGASTAAVRRAAAAAAPLSEVEKLLVRLRETLHRRGARGMVGLSRSFKIMDDDGSKSLNKYEFGKAMADFGLGLSKPQIEMLFDYYDADGSGTVDYDEFLKGVRGAMNERRRGIVAQAFKVLDTNGNGVVECDDIKLKYDASKNPDVIAGKKSEAEVLREFLDTFDSDTPDGRVTQKEFEDYYSNISASIDDDNYFQLMMWNAWGLAKASSRAPSYASDAASHGRKTGFSSTFTAHQIDTVAKGSPVRGWVAGEGDTATPSAGGDVDVSDVIKRLRATLARRGASGMAGLSRSFRIMDDDHSRSLSLYEFSKAMRDVGMGLSEPELRALFNLYDTDGNGGINYDEFLKGLRGQLNDHRRALVHQAFAKIDVDGSGVLDYTDIKHAYNANKDPDVMNGKKTEKQVLTKFLSQFDSGDMDGKVTLDEFEQYYAGISASIDEDSYFDLMMWNTWNLGEKSMRRSHKKAWGAEF